jgi:hypothetical protein
MNNSLDTDTLVSLDFHNYRELVGGDGCSSFFEECGDYKVAIILLVVLIFILFMKYKRERRRLQKDE